VPNKGRAAGSGTALISHPLKAHHARFWKSAGASILLLVDGSNKVSVGKFRNLLQLFSRFLEGQYPLCVFWYDLPQFKL
jgi:hypothetical protein